MDYTTKFAEERKRKRVNNVNETESTEGSMDQMGV